MDARAYVRRREVRARVLKRGVVVSRCAGAAAFIVAVLMLAPILTGALARDLFLLEACTMITVIIAVATQTIADIAYTFLNPRIRLQ